MTRPMTLLVLALAATGCSGGAGSESLQTVDVGISPTHAALLPGQQQVFAAAVTGTAATQVSWSVQEGAAGGTVTGAGLYTAPATTGTYHVVVTSLVDGTKSATASVTVSSTPVASTKESWIWPYNINTGWPPEIAAMDGNASAFTHLSPTFYSINYVTPYASGVPYYVTCAGGPAACTANGANNFGTFTGLGGASASYNGTTITTQSFTSWAHSRGFQVHPAIYAGSGNGGSDTSFQAVLCGGGGASGCPAQKSFITALVTELVANDFDGWNFDWETGPGYPTYASSFTAFVNALKAALVAAGKPNAMVSVDVILSNINGTTCSGGGWADFAQLQASSIDRVIIEDYSSSFQTAGWTVPTTMPSPLVNAYGSAVLTGVGGSTNTAYCDYSFTGGLAFMSAPNLGATPGLDLEKAVIGVYSSSNGTNPIAGQAMQYLADWGFTKVAVWPQYDSNAYPFLSNMNINPAGTTWYQLLNTFLGR